MPAILMIEVITVENDDAGRIATQKDLTNRDIFTREEKRIFLRTANTLQKLIAFRLGFYGGLRVSEITTVSVEDIIKDALLPPVIHVKESKGNKSRFACIDEATVQIAICYARGLGIADNEAIIDVSDRTVQRWIKEGLETSGIVRINATPHTMRHTNITMLISLGMDLMKVKDHAGHEDIRYTQIYTHLSYLDRAREYDQIVGE